MTLSTAQSPTSRLKDEAPSNIFFMFVTPEVSHAPMSSLKDSTAVLHPIGFPDAPQQELIDQDAQNKYDMSVTPPVAHVEMWPYVASAVALFENHASRAV